MNRKYDYVYRRVRKSRFGCTYTAEGARSCPGIGGQEIPANFILLIVGSDTRVYRTYGQEDVERIIIHHLYSSIRRKHLVWSTLAESSLTFPSQQVERQQMESTLTMDVKRRLLGTVRFTGELFVVSVVNFQEIHAYVERLLTCYDASKAEHWLEFAGELVTTIGPKMDDPMWRFCYPESQVDHFLPYMTIMYRWSALLYKYIVPYNK